LNRFNYHEIDFFKLVEQFRNNQMLHIKYAVQLLKDALNILIKYPNISNCDMTKSKCNLHIHIFLLSLKNLTSAVSSNKKKNFFSLKFIKNYGRRQIIITCLKFSKLVLTRCFFDLFLQPEF